MNTEDKNILENFTSHPVVRLIQQFITILLAILAFSIQKNLSNIESNISINKESIKENRDHIRSLRDEVIYNTNDINHLQKDNQRTEQAIKDINIKLDKVLERLPPSKD